MKESFHNISKFCQIFAVVSLLIILETILLGGNHRTLINQHRIKHSTSISLNQLYDGRNQSYAYDDKNQSENLTNDTTTKNDTYYIQQVIDELIFELSTKDYETWNGDITIDNHNFSMFSKSFMDLSLYNKSLLFHGNSLLFYFVYSILAIDLSVGDTNYSHPNMSTTSLWLFNKNTRYPTQFTSCCFNQLQQTFEPIGYHTRHLNRTLRFHYFEKNYIDLSATNANIGANITYNVVYTDLGLFHTMQLYPTRVPNIMWTNVGIHLESYVDAVVNYSIQSNAKCLIFRSPNPIANSRYIGKYKQFSTIYDAQNLKDAQYKKLIDGCVTKYNVTKQIIYEHPIGIYNVSGYDTCTKYPFTYLGSKRLKQRYKKYILWKQLQLIDNNMKIFFLDTFPLFDGHAENSEMSDGRHYTQLKPVELYVFTNIVNSFC